MGVSMLQLPTSCRQMTWTPAKYYRFPPNNTGSYFTLDASYCTCPRNMHYTHAYVDRQTALYAAV